MRSIKVKITNFDNMNSVTRSVLKNKAVGDMIIFTDGYLDRDINCMSYRVMIFEHNGELEVLDIADFDGVFAWTTEGIITGFSGNFYDDAFELIGDLFG